MTYWQEQTLREVSPSVLFPRPPIIRFAPQSAVCACGGQLRVQKSRRKNILLMAGPFIAHETVAQCPVCRRVAGSEALIRLVEPRCNVGYNILVYVGRAVFQRHRTGQEVRAELAARNVRLSLSEIDYLGRKFIGDLAVAHRRATPRIRRTMTMAGGYILHLDATQDGESPALMTGMDSLSQFVLANVKLPSEHATHIIPFLRQLAGDYGRPLACVRDMGSGIGKAIAEVFPGVHDFVCHFHFLRDIGKDYLEPAYARLRKGLRSHAVSTRLHALAREMRLQLARHGDRCEALARTIKAADQPTNLELMPEAASYSLALWALHGKQSGDGYGFPFDRPLLDFAQRLLELDRLMPQLLGLPWGDDTPLTDQTIFKVLARACFVAEDPEIRQAVTELKWRCRRFDLLRTAMRLAPVGGGNGLNDEGTDEAMSTIRQGVNEFRRQLADDPALASDPLSRKMAAQIDKYNAKLFADPISVATPNGPVTVYPQRTNNIMEQFFRALKRGHRRKTGNNSMQRTLQAMLADTPLVKNLKNSEYMKVLLDGKATLEELFADVAISRPADSIEGLEVNGDRILPGFRALMNLQTLPDQILRSLAA